MNIYNNDLGGGKVPLHLPPGGGEGEAVNYQLIQGDCLQTLKTLPAKSVQTCVTSPPYFGLRSYLDSDDEDKHLEVGTEETPEAYVAKLVDVFREVRRVLRDDATLWLNLGDSYYNYRPGNYDDNRAHAFGGERDNFRGLPSSSTKRGNRLDGLKEKDLIGIPWMVAFALRADGWWLRSDIIWHKPNPMPESVTDRPTKAHEYIFLLSKSREYFYDADAIREPLTEATLRRDKTPRGRRQNGGGSEISLRGIAYTQELGNMQSNVAGRNRRSVWTVTTKPYAEAHFATFPPDLIEPCILAGTSAHGCCAQCGAPWARVVEREVISAPYQELEGKRQREKSNGAQNGGINNVTLKADVRHTTLGWQPTCACNADVVPCTVLDPFNGSGTTGAVALKHGRRYIGCELNPAYIELSHKRIGQAQPMLLQVTP